MIPFNKPPVVGTELEYMKQAMESGKLCGDGNFTKKCEKWLEEQFHCHKTLLTPSCTASLEMAAILLDIKPGDEVIMPSFTLFRLRTPLFYVVRLLCLSIFVQIP